MSKKKQKLKAGLSRKVHAKTVKDPIEEGMGSLQGGSSLVDALLESRRQDKAREDRFIRKLDCFG